MKTAPVRSLYFELSAGQSDGKSVENPTVTVIYTVNTTVFSIFPICPDIWRAR